MELGLIQVLTFKITYAILQNFIMVLRRVDELGIGGY